MKDKWPIIMCTTETTETLNGQWSESQLKVTRQSYTNNLKKVKPAEFGGKETIVMN